MNTKMNVLALALLGLAGYAGSAVAGCPGSPVPPWTAVNALGGTAVIASPGYASTPCRLDSTLTGDVTGFATVEDDTPTAEPRYRAQFIINADNLTTLGIVDAAFAFSTSDGSTGAAPVSLSLVGDGAGGHFLSYNVADPGQASGGFTGSFALAAGPNYVEFDYDNGTEPGSPGPHFSIWVNNNVEGSPDFTTAITSTGVVDTAFLGMAGATPGYVASSDGKAVGFDQFDSRRQNFIGGF
jgi:hypothetical protein